MIVSLCHSDFDEYSIGKGDSEAGAVSASAAHSQGKDFDRGLSFVLNINRLNVALSRAQCLAIVVGSPTLVNTVPRTLQQQREINALCMVMEAGQIVAPF